MAQIDFPASPTNGQIFTPVAGGPSWQYDGTKWVSATTGATAYAPIASPAFTGNPTAPTPPAGDADTSIATTQFVAASTAGALTNVGRNLLHNSMFNIAQRGTGPWTVGAITLDRWAATITTDAASITRTVLADVDRTNLGDQEAAFCLTAAITGNAAAGAYTQLAQRMENVRRLAGKTVTISFWAASSAALKIGINLMQYFGSGGTTPPPSAFQYVLATGNAITTSTAWTRYSTTIALPVITGKTLGTNGDDWTGLQFWLSSGATNNATAGNIGVQSGTINIWGVQLEIGSTATPLEKLDPVTQLQQCQRFYCTGQVFMAGLAASPFGVRALFPVFMRTSAPVLAFTPQANVNMGAITIAADGIDGAIVYGNATTASIATQIRGTYTASADL